MLFIARFDDKPGTRHLRRLERDAQTTYVETHEGKILKSGPLGRDDLGQEVGGLWYISAKSRRDAQELCYGAPFWVGGIWSNVTVMSQQASANPYANMRVTCL